MILRSAGHASHSILYTPPEQRDQCRTRAISSYPIFDILLLNRRSNANISIPNQPVNLIRHVMLFRGSVTGGVLFEVDLNPSLLLDISEEV